MLFAVKTDLYRYLKIAEKISNMTIVPIPRNQQYTEDAGSTEYNNEQLINLITRFAKDNGGNYSSTTSSVNNVTEE